ncbi:sigma factor [Promicromonospora thailandica]|uniref:DNA-directed RNA polymerase specialized sigma subunit n=1 Tax=Promicromonospora thailandica TaxID=765201 RepID=A0A9X2G8M1_9MICO|nr:sigma factor [Promicromonospora thailandica]MCP2265179.1 DNA-directed RNA polymerase specialized sigma subunit [Promicromonospora thailandica]
MPARMPAPASGTLMRELDHDWADLVRTRSFATEIERLVARFPQLAGLRSGDTVRLAPADADEVLYALIVEHARGSFAAGRAVLQCMLPAVRAIVRRSRRHYPDVQDLEQEAAAAMWDAITHYDLERSSRVAMRLQGHTLTRVVGDRAPHAQGGRVSRGPRVAEIPTDTTTLTVLEQPTPPEPRPDAVYSLASFSLGTTGEVLDVIAWGLDQGALTPEESALLARLYAPDPDLPEYAELGSGRGNYQRRVAQELGLSHAALRQRASRAVRRLAEAVQSGGLSGGQPGERDGEGRGRPTG